MAELSLHALNDKQREVVLTTQGPILVLAGAGTGKTRAVTTRIAHLLTHHKVSSRSILAVTFTNKAANEMRERILSLVGKTMAQGLTVSTFHSLCVRILRENAPQAGLGKGFTIYDERDQVSLIRAALREKEVTEKGLDPSVILSRISRAKSDLVPPQEYSDSNQDKYGEISQSAYATYQDLLQARNAVDFDDLIMRVIHTFRRHPEVLKKYHERFKYIMVDEFQDTSQSQFLLIELLAKAHRNLCVVGDDDQSIYGWRGAHPSNIRDFKRKFKGTHIVKLEENYRSTGNILQVANAVIAKNKKRMEKNLWTRQGEGSKVDLIVALDENDEAETVVKNITAFHERFKMPYRDAAILYRSNVQSRLFEEELRKRRVPYRLIGGQGFYDRKEVRDVVSYLKLLHNPKDEAALLRIINVPRRGIGETSLARVVETAHRQSLPVPDLLRSSQLDELAGPETTMAIHSFLGLIERYRQRFSADPLDQALASLLKEIDYDQELHRSSKSEQEYLIRKENVDGLMNSLSRYVAEEKKPSLGRYLDQVSLITKEDKPEMEGPDNAVTLMTIHSAKGLEFPAVFLVGMEEDLLPHARSMSDGADALSEERRLCYVAITRARKYLAIVRAESRRQYGKLRKRTPSRFLKQIPEDWVRMRTGLAGPAS